MYHALELCFLHELHKSSKEAADAVSQIVLSQSRHLSNHVIGILQARLRLQLSRRGETFGDSAVRRHDVQTHGVHIIPDEHPVARQSSRKWVKRTTSTAARMLGTSLDWQGLSPDSGMSMFSRSNYPEESYNDEGPVVRAMI